MMNHFRLMTPVLDSMICKSLAGLVSSLRNEYGGLVACNLTIARISPRGVLSGCKAEDTGLQKEGS